MNRVHVFTHNIIQLAAERSNRGEVELFAYLTQVTESPDDSLGLIGE